MAALTIVVPLAASSGRPVAHTRKVKLPGEFVTWPFRPFASIVTPAGLLEAPARLAVAVGVCSAFYIRRCPARVLTVNAERAGKPVVIAIESCGFE